MLELIYKAWIREFLNSECYIVYFILFSLLIRKYKLYFDKVSFKKDDNDGPYHGILTMASLTYLELVFDIFY